MNLVLQILRALFVLSMAAVGFYFVQQDPNGLEKVDVYLWLLPAIALTVAVLLVCVDILAPRNKLQIFAGTFLGLIVGLVLAFVLSFVVSLLFEQYGTGMTLLQQRQMIRIVNMMVALACCYATISLVLQTKDDFRFIIPYVEFSKQTRGARPILIDTSVLIDGRISDIAQTGIIESQMVVPRFVLDELQHVADSPDRLRRNRGRRGLDVLQKLQQSGRNEVILYDAAAPEEERSAGVDALLVSLAQQLSARILTNDFNLNKVAQLRGVDVINLNDLANALKPVVLPGERMTVRIVKAGEESGQGVGYLEDGTMVVVEQARAHMNEEVEFSVTSALQTSAGRMIFGRMGENAPQSSSRTPGGRRSDPASRT